MGRSTPLARDRAGNIAISAALTLPVAVAAMAFGIDYGHLTLQQRELQSMADLAAIAASASITDPEKAALDYFVLNNRNIAVRTAKGALTAKGLVPFDPTSVLTSFEAYAEVEKGRYVPDPARAAAARFEPGGTPFDAVRLTMHEKGALFFSEGVVNAPELAASGTATTDKVASFSIGTRLASLNEGIVNALLGKLLGTTISLSAMDYQALVDTQVDLLKTMDGLAATLGVTAGTYSDLLQTQIGYPKLVQALAKTTGLSPSVAAVVNKLAKAVDKTKVSLSLADILSLGPVSQRLIGQSDGLTVNASLMQILSAAATANQNGNQLDLDLGSILPGLGSVKLSMAIGEPPAETPPLAAGATGTIVRSAQARLSVEATVDGLAALLGLKIRVPLYVEIAYAEAQLAAITCTGSGKNSASVDIDAVPGVAEIALGDVDKTAFANFGKVPRVVKADLVTSLLVDVTALVDVKATNSKPTRVNFSPTEIAAGKVKTVSTQSTLTTLTDSLLSNLTLEVQLLGLPLLLPKAVTSALGDTLKLAMGPIDTLLYNLLLTLGVKVGEADIRVGGAVCRNPVLVQ